jgi:hypothetical protein|tara:strand:+ start:709 stop:1053 length:345 start_codon:yes stop_codon:yes gene_type:complete
MAVSKKLVKTTPYVKSSKVEKWHLEMQYENDSEGDATYYTSTFEVDVNASDTDPVTGAVTNNFTKAAKGTFSNADLVALCPVSRWDAVFTSQVDSVITNPPSEPVPDNSFSVPS